MIEANHPMRGMLSFQDGMTRGLVQGKQRWAYQMVGIIMMAGNRWVSGNGCHQISCKRDIAWHEGAFKYER